MSTCTEGPQKAKQRFMDNLTKFVHKTELESIHFAADRDWNTYEIEYDDLLQLEYPKHAEYLSPVERQQVDALIQRYGNAKTNYYTRRIEEKVNSLTTKIKDFLSTP
jgi:hypothetical protein